MSLYARLLGWFLLANLATAGATVFVGSWMLLRTYSEAEAQRDGEQAAAIYESGGSAALEQWLADKGARDALFGILLDARRRPLARPPRSLMPPPGERPDGGLSLSFELERGGSKGEGPERGFALSFEERGPPKPGPLLVSGSRTFGLRVGRIDQLVSILSDSGTHYYWHGIKRPPRYAWLPYADMAMRLGVALLVVAGVALLAARRLARPIQALQGTAQRFAAGELAARAPPALTRRRDELGALARAFDHMAAALARLVQRQRQLLRDVSHELRSPLARLTIAGELAREQGKAEHFDRIQLEIQRLEEMIGMVLTLARTEASLAQRQRCAVSLDELLADICLDAAVEATPRKVEVLFADGEPCAVQGDAQLLRAALENVIRNALRYTAEGTAVSVELKCADGRARISVCDRGPGVPADQLETIFEPFMRVSQARERDSGGYGLGLALARDAVHGHDGVISAALRPDGGLCVTIELPADRSPLPGSAPAV